MFYKNDDEGTVSMVRTARPLGVECPHSFSSRHGFLATVGRSPPLDILVVDAPGQFVLAILAHPHFPGIVGTRHPKHTAAGASLTTQDAFMSLGTYVFEHRHYTLGFGGAASAPIESDHLDETSQSASASPGPRLISVYSRHFSPDGQRERIAHRACVPESPSLRAPAARAWR